MAMNQSDVAAIENVRRVFVESMSSDDLDRMFAVMTDDFRAFPPNQPADLTKAAHRRAHEQRVAQFATRIEVSESELTSGGDVVFDCFSYRIALRPRAGGPERRDSGNCVWLWRRDAGSWKVARAIWNSDQPLAAAV